MAIVGKPLKWLRVISLVPLNPNLKVGVNEKVILIQHPLTVAPTKLAEL